MRYTRLCVAVGIVLLLTYVLPLFIPPPSLAVALPAADAGIIARMFPRVPSWWMSVRLAALIAGAALLAAAARGRVFASAPAASTGASAAPVALQNAGVAAAVLHVACLPWVSRLPAVGQMLYVLWLGVPGALLAWGARPRQLADKRSGRDATWATAGVIAVWVVARLWTSWHAPRVANVVDMWRTFAGLTRLAAQHANFLSVSIDPEIPGVNSTPLFFHGLSLLQILGHAPGLTWVQVANTAWMAACAALVAMLAADLVGAPAAVVATAAFLFSPFSLLAQISPTPVFIGPLLAACLALLLVKFLRSHSLAALAWLGGVAGITATWPALVPLTGLTLAVVAWKIWSGARVPAAVAVTALLSCVAMAGPSIPSADAVRAMLKLYAQPHGHAPTLELVVLGQIQSVAGAARGWELGAPRLFDVPLAALLSPFAISRSAMRLCGDTVLDPLGAALAAVGIAVCIRRAARDRVAPVVLAFLAAALVPGFVSSTDTPSLLRVFGAPIPLAVLAAIGFVAVQRVVASAAMRRVAVLAVVVAVCAGGTVIFDLVNPRILADSALGLAARSVEPADAARAAVLTAEHENEHWLYVDEIMHHVPRQPIAVVPAAAILGASDGRDGRDVFLWSPAVEQTAGLRRRFCERWPDARLYSIADRAGLSRLYGGALHGVVWSPALPGDQWSVTSCGKG